jgi:uncharacterized protein (DUF1684 family)
MTSRLRIIAGSLLVIVALATVVARATTSDEAYHASVEKWRADYEADLKSDSGWLTISGLFWLHDGENHFGTDPKNDVTMPQGSAPADAGYFEVHGAKITAHIKPDSGITVGGKQVATLDMKPDDPNARLVTGDVALWIHASGDRYAVRMKDKKSPLRSNFNGLHWFPVNSKYRVIAHYTPYPKTKPTPIKNLAGDSISLDMAGYVTFTLEGQQMKLDAEAGRDGALVFTMHDLTSGKETYAAARFLDTDPVKDGKVVLDFNEAYNPPCAYNPYTTCPLAPPQNRLNVRVEAGEMVYHRDH